MRLIVVVALVALVSALIGAYFGTISHAQAVPSGKLQRDAQLQVDDWLLGAPSDIERFRRLQQQLSGFDQPMWEIGERWTRLHEALRRENYEFAVFQWWKIEQRIQNAIVKRPQRAANARAMFLGENYERLKAEFESHDPQRAWQAFATARGICQACHVAERSAFVNDQPVFDLAPPADQPAVTDRQ